MIIETKNKINGIKEIDSKSIWIYVELDKKSLKSKLENLEKN